MALAPYVMQTYCCIDPTIKRNLTGTQEISPIETRVTGKNMQSEKNGKEKEHKYEIIALLNRISKSCTFKMNFQKV